MRVFSCWGCGGLVCLLGRDLMLDCVVVLNV